MRLLLYLSALPSRAPSHPHILAHSAFTASTTVISLSHPHPTEIFDGRQHAHNYQAMYTPALILIVHHGYNTQESSSSQRFTVGFGLSGPSLSRTDPEVLASSKPLPPLIKDPHHAPSPGTGALGPFSEWRPDGLAKLTPIAKQPGKMQIAIAREVQYSA